MKTLLVINTSPRTGRSHTRKLTGSFAAHWLKRNEGSSIIYRDLGLEHVPHMNESWIAAAFKRKEKGLPVVSGRPFSFGDLLKA